MGGDKDPDPDGWRPYCDGDDWVTPMHEEGADPDGSHEHA